MFSTIMLAPALFETTPNRKHQHINKILLYTDTNTIEVYTNKHIHLIFKGNYLRDEKILRHVVSVVNNFFKAENIGLNNIDIDGAFIEYNNTRKYLKKNGNIY